MFNAVSWSEYFVGAVLLTVVYYAVIGWKYFKWELLALMGIQRTEPNRVSFESMAIRPSTSNEIKESDEVPDISPVVEAFTDEIIAFAEAAKASNASKAHVCAALQAIVGKYPVLAGFETKPLRDGIIQAELNARTAVTLTSDELRRL